MIRTLVALLLVLLCGCGPDPLLGTVCRAADSTNPCDVDDLYVFDEVARARVCPATGGNAGMVCRRSAGPCDRAEVCDGKAEACPSDALYNSTIVCSTGARCVSTERCTGTDAGCPPQSNLSQGTPCREIAIERKDCDLADVCDGAGNCPDLVQPAGKTCTTGVCTGQSSCPLNYNRCCNQTQGTCSTAGSCPASSCNCFCTTNPC